MKTKIWKYEISLVGLTFLKIPGGAEFLSLMTQEGIPYIWFLVHLGNEVEDRTFITYVTGEALPDCLGIHMGSFQTAGGYVGHVFEEHS